MAALRAGVVVSTLAILTGQSYAQNAAAIERLNRQVMDALLGTTSVEAQPSFADGRLHGCIMEFNVLTKDVIYKQGGYIRIGGSFGIANVKGQVGITLKVILLDADPRTMNFTPSPPASAYFVSGNKTTKNAVVLSERSDTPGGIFVVLKPEPTFSILVDGLQRDKVTIAFARERGGTDIQVAIDTSVVATAASGERTHSPKASLDFLQCGKELLESMEVVASATAKSAPGKRP
jgi:hypothetical protein